MDEEFWKDIPGYEGLYQISNLGRVKSLDRTKTKQGHEHKVIGRMLKQIERTKGGRMNVRLYKNGKYKHHYVHVLVAHTFIGNIEGLEVCHLDSNFKNNNLNNLKLDTISENRIDEYRNGNINKNRNVTPKDVREIRDLHHNNIYNTIELSELYNTHRVNIGRISRGERFGFVDENGNIRPSKTAITYDDVLKNGYPKAEE